MATKVIKITIITITIVSMFCITGCENDAQTGALLGMAAGAGIGQLAGRSTEATLIGAAVGTGAGYFLGNEGDKKKAQAERAVLAQEINTVPVNVTNSNGSVVVAKLQRHGVGYVGPRGEYYASLPTSEQLRPVYGF